MFLPKTWELPAHFDHHLAIQITTILVQLYMVRWLYKRFTSNTIRYLPGPPKTHWLYGNLPDLIFEEVGKPQLAWKKEYGPALRVHGLLGDSYLMVSDPKAMQHMYANPDIFARQQQHLELFRIFMGPGITVVNGEDHRRQRRVMQPAFSTTHLKDLSPVFSRNADKLLSVMKKDIDGGTGCQKATVDVYDYLSRATLDIIGDAAFDYRFGALDNELSDLREAFRDMSLALRSVNKFQMFLQFVIEWIPPSIIIPLTHLPIRRYASLHAIGKQLDNIAERLINDKTNVHMKGLEGGKDLMSLLMRSNAAQEQKAKLSDIEVRAEIASITAAGHITSSSTISFAFWSLANDMDLQRRIRLEISQTLQRAREQGRTEISFDDYESMTLLVALIKEVLRWYPIAVVGSREVQSDTFIPLSHPIKLESGKMVSEIPISKGQKIMVDVLGHNRSPDIFGDDSHVFNVNRWLTDANKEKLGRGAGIYANLMTFGLGVRACIGWRFTLYEMQLMLITLISNFEFTVPEGKDKVLGVGMGAMRPTIQGDPDARAGLFLNASML